MTPPRFEDPDGFDPLAKVHEDLHSRFEMGTLYTVIAGLLNLLAIYDACAGPLAPPPEEESSEKSRGDPAGEDADT